MATIELCSSDDQIAACAALMLELRPHLAGTNFVQRVRRQMGGGYFLSCLKDGDVKALAGFRFGEFLAWGRVMYVDDLVVKETERGKGYGGQLLEWLKSHALDNGCAQFHLVSGTHRLDAHRFYQAHGMEISSYHFSMKL